MPENIKNKLKIPFYYVAATMIIETLLFLLLKLDFSKLNIIINYSIVLCIASIIFLLPTKRWQPIFAGIILSMHIGLMFFNYNLNILYGDIFTLQMLKLASEALAAAESSVLAIGVLIMCIIIAVTNIYVLIKISQFTPNLSKVNKKTKSNYIATPFQIVLIFVLTFSISLTGFNLNVYNLNLQSTVTDPVTGISIPVNQDNEAYLYQTIYFKKDALNTFGTYGYFWRDLVNFISPQTTDTEDAIKYLQLSNDAEKTDFHGTSAGNNVIVILAETLQPYAINQTLTPTLYSLTQGTGLDAASGNYTATNYYSKSKTNFSEIGAMTGTAPYFSSLSSGFGDAHFEDGALDYALSNTFAAMDYQTNYIINHDKEYYGRDQILTNHLDFENIYDTIYIPATDTDPGRNEYFKDFYARINGSVNWGEWAPDSMMMDYYCNLELDADGDSVIFPTDEKFFNWFTTMGMHGPYGVNSDDKTTPINGNFGLKLEELGYLDAIDQALIDGTFSYPETLPAADQIHYKWYQAAAMDFDAMLDTLLAKLTNTVDNNGQRLVDNTTIAIFGDHESYYYNLSKKSQGIDTDVASDPQAYSVPMFIIDPNFNSRPENYEVQHFVSYFDVHATILDLVGVTYKENLTLGQSLLTRNPDPYKVFISITTGIYSHEMFTFDGQELLNYREDQTPFTEEQIEGYYKSINETVFKASIQRLLFEKSLYAYV